MIWRDSLVPRSVHLALLAAHIFVPCAGKCIQAGACKNVINGNHERPALSGKQSYVNSDGTCRYGHVGANQQCQGGPSCGYTFHECVCISLDRAEQGSAKSRNVKYGWGISLLSIGTVLAIVSACYARTRTRRYLQSIKPQAVAPENHATVIGKGSQQEPSDYFSDPFSGPPDEKPAKTSQDEKIPDNKKLDWLAKMCLCLPCLPISLGTLLVCVAASAGSAEYFNQCAHM